jgi:hypothetical protein
MVNLAFAFSSPRNVDVSFLMRSFLNLNLKNETFHFKIVTWASTISYYRKESLASTTLDEDEASRMLHLKEMMVQDDRLEYDMRL